MRSKLSEWYEIGFRCKKTMEDGTSKFVTEQYVVEAMSFSEAEKNIVSEMKEYVSGPYEVKTIKKTVYKEVFFSDEDKDDKWYKAKLQFIIIDENTGKEKRSNVIYLVQSSSLNAVCKSIDEIMDGSFFDYESMSVQETKILDVFKH